MKKINLIRVAALLLALLTLFALVSCGEDGEKATEAPSGNQATETPTEGHVHTPVPIPEKAATCKAAGSTGGTKCSECKEIITAATEIPKLAHEEEDIPAVAATCSTDGSSGGKRCKVCQTITQSATIIPSTGTHSTKAFPELAATCTESGLTGGTFCKDCLLTITPRTIVGAKGGTCEWDGNVCKNCGAQKPNERAAFTAENFSKTLPATYTGDNVITIKGEDCETNCDTMFEQTAGQQFRWTTLNDEGKASANSCIKLISSGLFHYYIDRTQATFTEHVMVKEQGAEDSTAAKITRIPASEAYIRWEFDVTTPGTYNVCFNFRLKNNAQRWTQIQIDNQEVKDQVLMTYTISDITDLLGENENSYLTGWSVELTAGHHTITARLPEKDSTGAYCNSSWHFRNIYLKLEG